MRTSTTRTAPVAAVLAACAAVALAAAHAALVDEEPRQAGATAGVVAHGGYLPWPIYGPVSNIAPRTHYSIPEKRQMRNALVRFGRSGMRNALVRFGKRAPLTFSELAMEMKRNDAPQPFVRFGRSGGGAESRLRAAAQSDGGRFSTFDHMFDSADDTAAYNF